MTDFSSSAFKLYDDEEIQDEWKSKVTYQVEKLNGSKAIFVGFVLGLPSGFVEVGELENEIVTQAGEVISGCKALISVRTENIRQLGGARPLFKVFPNNKLLQFGLQRITQLDSTLTFKGSKIWFGRQEEALEMELNKPQTTADQEKRKVMFWRMRSDQNREDLRAAIVKVIGTDKGFEVEVRVGQKAGT